MARVGGEKRTILGFTPDQTRLLRIFFRTAVDRWCRAEASGQRFVHYTTADTAMKILTSKQAWLRRATCMNDFMEIEHGYEYLRSAYTSRKEHFARLFDGLFPGFTAEIERRFEFWMPHYRSDTYIACLSEHHVDEDRIGRLSMWRAYGGDCGVALVLNPTAFMSANDALGAYSHPVEYPTWETFMHGFDQMLSDVEANVDFLRAAGEDTVLAQVSDCFRVAVLCTKHPGFREEAEWRVIHSPRYNQPGRVTQNIVSVGGVPQPICVLPLEDVLDEGLFGLSIPGLIERVIVGPCQHPAVISEAFVGLLTAAGVADAPHRVFISDIPLRR